MIVNDIGKDRSLVLYLKNKLGISKVQNLMVVPIKNGNKAQVVVIMVNKYSSAEDEAPNGKKEIGKFSILGNPLLSPIFHNLLTHSL